MGSANIWASISQQLPVSDLSTDVSLMHWTPFIQQSPLVMMRPIASMAQFIVVVVVVIAAAAATALVCMSEYSTDLGLVVQRCF